MTFRGSLSRRLPHALRALARRPTFTLAAVVTLALGIGATTAIFSVVYSVLIKPLPYPNASELVRIRHSSRTASDLFASSNMYLTYRQENRTLASIGIWQETDATVIDRGEPERVRALRVADGVLQALGVQPLRGRWFTEAEHSPAAEGATPVILSHAYWQRRFGGDPAVLGHELSMEGPSGNGTLALPQPSQVVGVMPPDFKFLDMTPPPDVIIPVRLDPTRQAHGIYSWQMLARMKPGVTLAEVQADLERMRPIWIDAWPPFPGTTIDAFINAQIGPTVRSLQDDLVGGVASMLWVLMGAIGAVLAIACANIANLLLVRADTRRQELAVRAALGATPARVARELLGESFVLGAAGSVLGLVLAYVGLRLLVANGPSNLPRLQEISVYPPVLAFTVLISLASTVLFGSITALKQVLRVHVPLVGGARGSSASRERSRTRSALVVVQVALALALVVSAALMVRTFQALRDVDPGFSAPATIQLARIFVPRSEFADDRQVARLQHEMLDKIAGIPGVVSAALSSEAPMESIGNNGGIEIEGQTLAPGDPRPTRKWKFVSPGYFETMGTRVIAGREVTWADIEAGGRVAVISEDLARELSIEPAGALGKRIRLFPFPRDDWHEVIGVVQGIHHHGLYQPAPSSVYWPLLSQNMFHREFNSSPMATFAIRTERAGSAVFMEEVRQAVRSVSASVPVAQERTMQDLYAGSLARTSFTLVLLGIAGAMALALGVIGIYGVIAYVVTQRARELGIRSALGARPGQLERMFVREGLVLTAVGAVVGLVAAVVLTRAMSGLLFGVSSLDASAYAAALGVTLAAAALASYLPARRAAAVDPIETLRAE